jgi:hypothetical protein
MWHEVKSKKLKCSSFFKTFDLFKADIDWCISVSASLVPGLALCPGTGAAERLQETLYR